MEYAVVEIAGKRYKVKNGDILEVDHLKTDDSSISFDKVLLHVSDSDVNIGKPYIENLAIVAKVLEHIKGDKLRVARFTAKSRHRRVIGFRPSLTRIEIQKISAGTTVKTNTKKATTEAKKVKK